MASLRICLIPFCALLASACNGRQTADQVSINGAMQSDRAIEEADVRAVRLAEKASLLNAQAARQTGARRQALENEADADMSVAVSVERQGETDAENVAAATEREIQDMRR